MSEPSQDSRGEVTDGTGAAGAVRRRPPLPDRRRSAAVFWLGEQFCFGHLGASSDRDFASPGLLGVRWDGPAGGSTWGGRTAGRRPADGGATYVSAPLPPAGCLGGQKFQVGAQDAFSTILSGRVGPIFWRKKRPGYLPTCRFRASLIRQSPRRRRSSLS